MISDHIWHIVKAMPHTHITEPDKTGVAFESLEKCQNIGTVGEKSLSMDILGF